MADYIYLENAVSVALIIQKYLKADIFLKVREIIIYLVQHIKKANYCIISQPSFINIAI